MLSHKAAYWGERMQDHLLHQRDHQSRMTEQVPVLIIASYDK